MAEVQYVAFYGTLRRGEKGYRALQLQNDAGLRWSGMCRIPGQLYHLGAYPGLVRGEGDVTAELFALTDAGLLARLDEYEGYTPGNTAKSLFVRQIVRIPEYDLDCWVYYYTRPLGDAPLIVSGDWLG